MTKGVFNQLGKLYAGSYKLTISQSTSFQYELHYWRKLDFLDNVFFVRFSIYATIYWKAHNNDVKFISENILKRTLLLTASGKVIFLLIEFVFKSGEKEKKKVFQMSRVNLKRFKSENRYEWKSFLIKIYWQLKVLKEGGDEKRVTNHNPIMENKNLKVNSEFIPWFQTPFGVFLSSKFNKTFKCLKIIFNGTVEFIKYFDENDVVG